MKTMPASPMSRASPRRLGANLDEVAKDEWPDSLELKRR